MTDSVKCLGFNELLKQAESVEEIVTIFEQMESRVELKLEDRRALNKFGKKRMVSVDVLKGFSLVKEHPLRNAIQGVIYQQKQIQMNFEHEWMKETKHKIDEFAQRKAQYCEGYSKGIKHTLEALEKVLDETRVNSSLQEKKESNP